MKVTVRPEDLPGWRQAICFASSPRGSLGSMQVRTFTAYGPDGYGIGVTDELFTAFDAAGTFTAFGAKDPKFPFNESLFASTLETALAAQLAPAIAAGRVRPGPWPPARAWDGACEDLGYTPTEYGDDGERIETKGRKVSIRKRGRR